jgi:hypothetical protein
MDFSPSRPHDEATGPAISRLAGTEGASFQARWYNRVVSIHVRLRSRHATRKLTGWNSGWTRTLIGRAFSEVMQTRSILGSWWSCTTARPGSRQGPQAMVEQAAGEVGVPWQHLVSRSRILKCGRSS